MAVVGWVDSEIFDLHENAAGHPECPERLQAIRDSFAARGVAGKLVLHSPQEVDRTLLEQVHDPLYVTAVEKLAAEGGGDLDPNTRVGSASWQAAQLAAGAVVQATEKVLAGEWQAAFCSVRPPGHHARPKQGMGFCLFGNVALAAEAALASGLVERVAILDWDVHHGNGTQEIFWSRKEVLYASWHQYPFYPGSGAESEIGEGEGEGTTVNCPLARGAGNADYLKSWRGRILPALEGFEPELLLISAGFDADARDPLGGHEVTASGFEQLSGEIIEWARGACLGRVVSVLEGGYDLEALGENARLHVETLLG
jgi:acetoin utilization deacetylase AcuC-like enzyme